MNKRKPYRITTDVAGCKHCGAGRTWTVIGPDGLCIGMSWELKEDAIEYAEDMTRAYMFGVDEGMRDKVF